MRTRSSKSGNPSDSRHRSVRPPDQKTNRRCFPLPKPRPITENQVCYRIQLWDSKQEIRYLQIGMERCGAFSGIVFDYTGGGSVQYAYYVMGHRYCLYDFDKEDDKECLAILRRAVCRHMERHFPGLWMHIWRVYNRMAWHVQTTYYDNACFVYDNYRQPGSRRWFYLGGKRWPARLNRYSRASPSFSLSRKLSPSFTT